MLGHMVDKHQQGYPAGRSGSAEPLKVIICGFSKEGEAIFGREAHVAALEERISHLATSAEVQTLVSNLEKQMTHLATSDDLNKLSDKISEQRKEASDDLNKLSDKLSEQRKEASDDLNKLSDKLSEQINKLDVKTARLEGQFTIIIRFLVVGLVPLFGIAIKYIFY